jgi:HEPN domain-containing protein
VKEFQEEVGKLADFSWINRYKRVLLIAEEAYTPSLYGDVESGVEDSKEVVYVASQLIELLEVSRIVKLG